MTWTVQTWRTTTGGLIENEWVTAFSLQYWCGGALVSDGQQEEVLILNSY